MLAEMETLLVYSTKMLEVVYQEKPWPMTLRTRACRHQLQCADLMSFQVCQNVSSSFSLHGGTSSQVLL